MARSKIKGLFDVPEHLAKARGKRGRPKNTRLGQLSKKQLSFIDEYMIDQNGAAAVRRAGYSQRSAAQYAVMLMKQPFIKAEIERRLSERMKQTELTADSVLAKMKLMTSGDVRDVFDNNGDLLHPRRLPDHIAMRVSGVKVMTKTQPSDTPDGGAEVVYITEIKFWNPDTQLTNLAKALAMFSDRPAGEVVITIQGGLPEDDFAPAQPDIDADDKPVE